EQLGEIFAGIRILQPEEHVVHDRRERRLACRHGSGRAGAGGGHADSQGGGGEDDISATAIGHDPGPWVDGLRAHEYRVISSMPRGYPEDNVQGTGSASLSDDCKD